MLISRLTESAMMVEFGQQITAETTAMIADYVTFIKTQYSRELIDVTPSYTKVMLHFRLDCNCYSLLVAASEQWFADHQQRYKGSCHLKSKLHQLPVYYHSDVAPDLATVAEHSQLTEQQVITRHSDKIYQVGAIGFTAGFAFFILQWMMRSQCLGCCHLGFKYQQEALVLPITKPQYIPIKALEVGILLVIVRNPYF